MNPEVHFKTPKAHSHWKGNTHCKKKKKKKKKTPEINGHVFSTMDSGAGALLRVSQPELTTNTRALPKSTVFILMFNLEVIPIHEQVFFFVMA